MTIIDDTFVKIAVRAFGNTPNKINPFKNMSNFKGKGTTGFYGKMGILGAGLIISQFAEEVIKYFKNRHLNSKSPKFFKKMLNKNPKLMEEDPEEVATLWETLWETAPHAAQDPIMAGGFIKQNIDREVLKEQGGPPTDSYKLLVDLEKSKIDTGPSVDNKLLSTFMGMITDNE